MLVPSKTSSRMTQTRRSPGSWASTCGFAGPACRYYNDLWELDLAEMKWTPVGNPTGGGPWPSPRSGCQLALHGDTLFVYGGYSKVRPHALLSGLPSP